MLVANAVIAKKQKHQEKLLQQELESIERARRLKETLKKWVPDDNLSCSHNRAVEIVGKIPNLLKKIKQHQEKISIRQNEIERIQNKYRHL